MTKDKTPSVVEVQNQIRNNASQLQDYFSDLYAWEKTISKKDLACKRAAKTCREVPPPRTARVVDKSTWNGGNEAGNGKKPDAHVYDKGYKVWEKFDVDAALKESDQENDSMQKIQEISKSMEASVGPRQVVATSKKLVTTKRRDELEREEGNAHYKRCDYVAAISSYTRCLGYNPHNAVVLSNRAMAYLKNREFANAEDDCTLALKVDPTHVKSYSRRGTARNSLGKHRLALLDFYHAAILDPKSRQIQAQLQSTRELIRTAIKRSPKRTEFSIVVVETNLQCNQSCEADSAASENKENLESQQLKKVSLDTDLKPISMQGTASSPLPQDVASLQTTLSKNKSQRLALLPKLPKKGPATSYEFGRVWKTLALHGDAEQIHRLLKLRADYLLLIDPPTLCSVFKTAIESDVLCEIFHVLRHGVLSASTTNALVPTDTASFVLAFVRELTKVPRFNMTIMLLSASEREDMAWVVQHLEALAKDSSEIQEHDIADLRKLYELP